VLSCRRWGCVRNDLPCQHGCLPCLRNAVLAGHVCRARLGATCDAHTRSDGRRAQSASAKSMSRLSASVRGNGSASSTSPRKSSAKKSECAPCSVPRTRGRSALASTSKRRWQERCLPTACRKRGARVSCLPPPFPAHCPSPWRHARAIPPAGPPPRAPADSHGVQMREEAQRLKQEREAQERVADQARLLALGMPCRVRPAPRAYMPSQQGFSDQEKGHVRKQAAAGPPRTRTACALH